MSNSFSAVFGPDRYREGELALHHDEAADFFRTQVKGDPQETGESRFFPLCSDWIPWITGKKGFFRPGLAPYGFMNENGRRSLRGTFLAREAA